jgi:hypothetical protein
VLTRCACKVCDVLYSVASITFERFTFCFYKPPNSKYLRTDRIGGLYASNSRPYSRIVRIISSKEYDGRMDVVEFEAITLLYSYTSHEVCGILIH